MKSGVCSRSSSAAWLVSSTASSADRPASGAAAACELAAVEPKLDGDPRLARAVAGRVLARRMPVQHGVAVVEQMRSHHERLGAPPFLGRAAVKPQRSLDRAALDLFA